MKPLIVATAAFGLLLTSGCVLSVTGDGHDSSSSHREIRKQERNAREYIATLSLGTPSTAVMTHLGVPDFTEVFAGDKGEYRILRYRTHRTTSDGDITRDETTPLVFLSGRLVGVGEAAVARLQ